MGDLVSEAHSKYIKLMAYQQDRIGQQDDESLAHIHQQRQNIVAIVLQFLCVCRPEKRFRYTEFSKIISDCSKTKTFEPEKAGQAFLSLEDYIVLLYLKPWKTEYHTIKKFGGYYQTKIASHIVGAEVILSLIGFTDLTTGLLILSHHTKQDVLQYIAFECLVASAECLIISQIWGKVDRTKLSITDVVDVRLKNTGNADAVIAVIERKFGPVICDKDFHQGYLVKKNRDKRNIGTIDSAQFHDKLQEHMKKAQKIARPDLHNDIPYMDEDVKEIDRKPENFEDHLLASLRLVGDKEVGQVQHVISETPAVKPSEEWSFVREGLEKNLGKKYFEGPREDILKPQSQILGKSGGYDEIVVKPVYENISAKGTSGPKIQAVSPIPCKPYIGGQNDDSAYQSASTFYPPKQDVEIIGRGPVKSDIRLKDSIGTAIPYKPYIEGQNEDSAYLSASTFYPPKLEENESIRRGFVKSEIIQTKGQTQTTNDMPKMYTAPIAKKTQDMIVASRTFPGSQKSSNVPLHMENIRKYHKSTPSSMPVEKDRGSERIDRRKFTSVSPAGQRPVSYGLSTRTSSSLQTTGHSRTSVPKSLNIPVDERSNATAQMYVGDSVIKQSPLLDHTASGQEWQCSHCTFLNTTREPVCTICFKTRDTMEIDCPVVGEISRVCSKCTLQNDPDCTNCTACGNELRGIQTVI